MNALLKTIFAHQRTTPGTMRCRYCMNVMFLLSETHCFKVKSFSLPSPHFLPLPSPLPTLYLSLSHVMYVHYTHELWDTGRSRYMRYGVFPVKNT